MKRKYLSLLLLILPFLLSIGFSAWIIIYTFEFEPEYQMNEVANLFNYSYTYTYDGTTHEPQPKTTPSGDVTFTYQYKYTDQTTFQEGAPANGGEYDVLITASGDLIGSCQVRVIIEKLKIKAKPITVTYTEMADKSTWGSFADYIYGKLEYTKEDGSALPNSVKPSVNSTIEMTNGDSNCYYLSNDSDVVVGSTYALRLDLYGMSIDNFLLYDYETYYDNGSNIYGSSGSTIVKYQTVLIGSTYYTIEDALAVGGTIVLAGSSSTVFTAFTNLKYYNSKKEYSLGSASTLWITYDGTTTPYTITYGADTVYSVLYIPENVKLTVNGTINICAMVSNTAHETTTRGVLFNNGNMIVSSTGIINSYGYLKGDGLIDAQSGSKIIDVIRFYNYHGSGGIMLSMTNADIFPLSCYSMHNISCKIKINPGSSFAVFYYIDMSVAVLDGSVVMVGSGGLFELQNGYVYKYVEDTTSSFYSDTSNLKTHYKSTNQDVTQREKMEVYGTFTDNVLSIGTGGYGITTGKDYAMPIGFMSFEFKKDSEGNVGHGILSANSYKFYPGSKLVLNEGTIFEVSDGISVIFYDENFNDSVIYDYDQALDQLGSYRVKHSAWHSSGRSDIGAQFIVNGELIVNGNLGGEIKTSSNTGIVTLSNTSASLPRAIQEGYIAGDTSYQLGVVLGRTYTTVTTDTINAIGNIAKVEDQIFTDAMYVAQKEGSICYWSLAKNAKPFTINFNDGTSIYTKTFYVLNPDEQGNYIYTVLGTEYIPTKEYYDFAYWKYNGSDATNTEFDVLETTSITLEAYWVPINYKFEYVAGYVDSDNNLTLVDESTGLVLSGTDSTFTIEYLKSSNITINTTATYLDKSFNGWYLANDINELINLSAKLIEYTLTLDDFKLIDYDNFTYDPDNNCYVFNIYSVFTDEKKYTINYVTNIDEFTYGPVEVTDQGILTLPEDQNNTYKNNNTVQTYVSQWCLDQGGTIKVSNGESMLSVIDKLPDGTGSVITIYGITSNKPYTLTYYSYDDETVYQERYYNDNQKITILDKLAKPVEDTTFRRTYTFASWQNKNDSTTSYQANQEIGIAQNLFDSSSNITHIEVIPSYTWIDECKITIETSNATVTITHNGNTVNNGDYILLGETIDIKAEKTSNRGVSVKINGDKKYEDAGPYEGTYKLEGHTTISATGTSCIPSGTLITMADGSQKKIEDVTADDMLLVFNHETGKFEPSKILVIEYDGWTDFEIINLEFSNGTTTRLIYEHGYFNKTLNKYVYITSDNYKEYIGHEFIYYNGSCFEEVILKNSYITYEYVGCYCPVTVYHFNFFADGMLSITGGIKGLFNFFEYDDTLKYDEELMLLDIEQYGLLPYEVFKDIMPYEMYEMLPAKYMNIAINKGMLTFDDILAYIKRYLEGNGIL